MTTTREHTAGQHGPVLFEVTTIAAHVTVIVEDRPATLVTVSTPAETGPAADAVRRVTFEGGTGVVSVLLTEPTGGMLTGTVVGAVFGSMTIVNGVMAFGGSAVNTGEPISIEARLPLGSSLACETTSGNIGTRGALADVDAVTVSGDVRIDAVHLARLHTTSGTVRVARLTGTQATARTVSGGIRINTEMPGATVRATSVSGDIRVTGPDIDLDARTVSGRVTTR